MSYDVYYGHIYVKKKRHVTPGIIMEYVPQSEWHLVKSCANVSDAYEELSHYSCDTEKSILGNYYVTEFFVVEETKEKGIIWLKSAKGIYTVPKRFAMNIGILTGVLLMFAILGKVCVLIYDSGISGILDNIAIIGFVVFVLGVFIYGCIDGIRKWKRK